MRWTYAVYATGFFCGRMYIEDAEGGRLVYIVGAVVLNFLVDWLLLICTQRIFGSDPGLVRAGLGALLGALYCGFCLLWKWHFLGNGVVRILCMVIMAAVALGYDKGLLPKMAVFMLLSACLQGIATGLENGRWLLAAVSGLVCTFMMSLLKCGGKYTLLELCYNGICIPIVALHDSGNTLRDPITGRPVLIVSAEIAEKLFGLKSEQLRHPVEIFGSLPGMQLIPFRTIGQDSGMLLARQMQVVKGGKKKENMLVAFSPVALHPEGKYQALTGGYV